ncbi:Dyp-type peroxidase [Paractinoplanes brasiliensis]|uniref:Dye decolorizing peroxidase n=1 Tax=Paractinoplanes brasiliensis TaxID=52695 RepID=A0A4R6JB25_9ACTN|nr:Dyp-type peroxidase [Actinoplanes brasiliensis]TDO32457.1 dye decolorizing peroxidase [Actinoplanes brasiliensis]GID27670.1 peroxidase [Actinoplanes brasiliensis]
MTTRRHLLAGGAAVAGLGVAGGAAVVATTGRESVPATAAALTTGTATVPFHGPRQAGVAEDPPAHAAFVAFTLPAGTDRRALARMMRLLTDDVARLTQGVPALGDTDAPLAVLPARLTVTFGFGPGLYRAAGLRPPVADLPKFRIDRLESRWSGGDLLLQICADDPLTVAHTQRMLIKDTRPFAAVRWVQQGFRRSPGVQAPEHTQRNLLGQLDGTANPRGAEIEPVVWNPDGSTTLVVRRIRAEIETWDKLAVTDKENAVGRRLESGAPLSGTKEHDEPDFAQLDESGLPAMPDFSHVTRARVTDPKLKILRRPYNYDGAPNAAGHPDSGLIFASYQRSITEQYLPIQQRLADKDLLNEWITPIGSAVFAVPPGCSPGGWIGEQVLT